MTSKRTVDDAFASAEESAKASAAKRARLSENEKRDDVGPLTKMLEGARDSSFLMLGWMCGVRGAGLEVARESWIPDRSFP